MKINFTRTRVTSETAKYFHRGEQKFEKADRDRTETREGDMQIRHSKCNVT